MSPAFASPIARRPERRSRPAPGSRPRVWRCSPGPRRVALAIPGTSIPRVSGGEALAGLNNNDAGDGSADIVRLIEVDGTPCSEDPYSAAGIPDGVPLERGIDGSWAPALDATGSPLRPPRPPAPIASPFDIQPRRVGPGLPVTLEWALPWPRATLAIRVFDLEGGFVAHAATALEAGARGALAWTPSGLAPGVYVVSLLAHSPAGASVSAARVLQVSER